MASTVFAYRAVDPSGRLVQGTLAGEDPDNVVDRVRRMGLRPVRIQRKRFAALQRDFAMPGFGGKKADALAVMSRQFATMISAGTPILRCLTTLEKQASDPGLARALAGVRADIENGDQLSDALERQPAWFSELYVAMVRAGESSGSLDVVLERLAQATEAASRLRKKVRSALAYPTVVACLIGLTTLAMLLFLVPTFRNIYADLKGTLPVPTQVLLFVSGLLTTYFPVVAGAAALGIWWLRRWKRTDAGRLRWDRWRMRLPVFGRLVRLSALARFSRSLAVLVQTGVPSVQALLVARTTAANRMVADAVEDIAGTVTNGGRLSEGLAGHEAVFTDMVVQMVAVGEETGALDELLCKIADMYEAEVESTVDSLTSLLEPLLIVLMGVTVGGMLLAVYLPMFKAVELVR